MKLFGAPVRDAPAFVQWQRTGEGRGFVILPRRIQQHLRRGSCPDATARQINQENKGRGILMMERREKSSEVKYLRQRDRFGTGQHHFLGLALLYPREDLPDLPQIGFFPGDIRVMRGCRFRFQQSHRPRSFMSRSPCVGEVVPYIHREYPGSFIEGGQKKT